MNREIKFRAWSPKWQRMILPDDAAFSIDVHAHTAWKGSADDESIELMQYTGLKDKNGVEIYEGDFVEFHEDEQRDVYLVQFKFGAFYLSHHECAEYDEFMTYGMDWSKGPQSDQLASREVIGNIHENPDLVPNSIPEITK